jgi:periodic tryptophan protein 1
MISSLAWMPRGRAKAVPSKYEPTDAEMAQMRKEARMLGAAMPPGIAAGDDEWEDMSDSEDEEAAAAEAKAKAIRQASKAAQVAANMGDDDLAEYNLDDYDDEEGGVIGVLGPAGLSVFASNDEDPYVTLPDEEDDSDMEEDNVIRPSDALILACHSEEDAHTLDVYVYDDSEGTLFVHHDLMLNAFPLCVTWMDTATKDGTVGNYAAIGTMDTEIEVWDLDCIDRMTPAAVLGGTDKSGAAGGSESKGKKKKKNKDKPKLKEGSHRDAVLGMSWHPLQRHVLGSASADKTVKIWDVPQETCLHTLSHHTDKVQALQWHPTQASVLLTGGFDRNASVCDVRATAADWKAAAKWAVSSDVECVAWDPQSEHQFLVSTDNGTVTCHDARYAGKDPVFTIGAHTEACTGLAVNALVPGILATASLDKSVKLWDIRGGKVEYLGSRTLDFGQVFCCGFCTDAATPYVLALGGKDGKVLVWDIVSNASVRQRFPTGKKDEDYAGVDEALEKMALDGQDSSDYSDSEEEEAIKKASGEGGAAKGKAQKKKKKNNKDKASKPKK